MLNEARGKKVVLLVIFLSLFLGISTFSYGAGTAVEVKKYREDISYPATDPEKIKVFHKEPEGRKFIGIGEITVDAVTDLKEAEKIFKIKAAEFGADAVYIFKIISHAIGVAYPDDSFFYYGRGHLPRHHRYKHYRDHYRHSDHYYPHRYYYCYGSRYYTEEIPYMTVIGIAIKYQD